MKIIISIFSLFIWLGCKTNEMDATAEGEKLMQVSRDWSKVAGTNNMDSTLSYWADTAILMMTGMPMLKGKTEIRQMIEATAKIPGFAISWEPVSVSLSEDGTMAYMIEKNKVTELDAAGQPQTKTATGVTIWRKDKNGDWKNVIEVMNDDPVVTMSNQ